MRTIHRLAAMAAILGAVTAAASAQQPPAALAGDWHGTLATGVVNLRLAVHLTADSGGQLTGTLDSLDQGAIGLKFRAVTFDGQKVRLELASPPAAFEGTLSADGKRIDGRWMQGGGELPLTLERGAFEAPRRPQEPKPPFPYTAEEVTYQNKAAGITLAGTLTLPKTTPAPAVILITGSGPEDRDETVFGHKPFLVLADHLTRSGIAVLRVDDRGVGGSSGRTNQSTSDDFAGDVQAGIEYLKTRKEVDPKRIGLVGHSEGGLVAPIVASRSADVAFVVLMAGPGLPGDEILYLQAAAIAKAGGATDAQIAANRAVQEQIFKVVKTEPDAAAAAAKLKELREQLLTTVPDAQKPAAGALLDNQMRTVATPWFRYFLTYDPRPALAKVKCPVLAIVGERDLQVPWEPNLEAIGGALRSGGNANVTLTHVPALNHLFQTAATGSPAEYAQIEETIAPAALDAITNWIRNVAGLK